MVGFRETTAFFHPLSVGCGLQLLSPAAASRRCLLLDTQEIACCCPPPALQLYPYHLSEYVCRVMRMTPFKYYNDVLFLTLKDEKSYDRIPNFTVSLIKV